MSKLDCILFMDLSNEHDNKDDGGDKYNENNEYNEYMDLSMTRKMITATRATTPMTAPTNQRGTPALLCWQMPCS